MSCGVPCGWQCVAWAPKPNFGAPKSGAVQTRPTILVATALCPCDVAMGYASPVRYTVTPGGGLVVLKSHAFATVCLLVTGELL